MLYTLSIIFGSLIGFALGLTGGGGSLLAVPLLVGFGVAFAGLFRHLQPMVYGEPPAGQQPVHANMIPVMVHLALVLWLGLSIPGFLARWFEQATLLISGASPL